MDSCFNLELQPRTHVTCNADTILPGRGKRRQSLGDRQTLMVTARCYILTSPVLNKLIKASASVHV